MAGKKIISDVIVTRPRKELVKEIFREEAPVFTSFPGKMDRGTNKRFAKLPGFTIFIIVALAVFMVARAVSTSRLEISITPKSLSVAVDKNLVLAKSAAINTSILYITGVLEHERAGVFDAEESKLSEKKAEGIVVIYNKSSKDAQILISSTRLESPEGKIYRIPSMVVIPGYSVVNGKTVPGSKEVKIVADQPGSAYNVGLTDFTIPGFKGTSKYETIFARSKTEIGGGFSGATKIVTKNAVDSAVASISGEVNKNLKNIISKELLKDQFLLPGSEEFVVVDVEVSPKVGEAAEKFNLKISGRVRWATIKKKDMASALVKNGTNQASFGALDSRITNQDALALKLSGYHFDAESFNLNIKGNAHIEAYLDPVAIKEQLAKKGITNANDILNNVPGATRAEAHFKPVWAGSLPKALFNPATHPDRIDIQIVSR